MGHKTLRSCKTNVNTVLQVYLVNENTNKTQWIIDQLCDLLKHLHHKLATLKSQTLQI